MAYLLKCSLWATLLVLLSACRWEYNVTGEHTKQKMLPPGISGSVYGLSGTGLVLQNVTGQYLALSSNGNFTIAAPISKGSVYNVTVRHQPVSPSQFCTVTNGSGTAGGAPVTNVRVDCMTLTFTIGGTVSGLTGSGLVVQNNSADNTALNANGNFTFSTQIPSGGVYHITVLTQPVSPRQLCTLTNGAGTVAATAVTDVQLVCELMGDVNGDGVVDYKDALLAQRIGLGMAVASSDQLARGDIHTNGVIDVSDYLVIQKMGLGL